MVEARTRYEPHAMWGMNTSTSIKNAARDTKNVRIIRMLNARRNLPECAGEWKWEVTARMNMSNVRPAATGWRIKIIVRVSRTVRGISKSLSSETEPVMNRVSPVR
jgi:hypothetical protein